jgi:hypothetical protein
LLPTSMDIQKKCLLKSVDLPVLNIRNYAGSIQVVMANHTNILMFDVKRDLTGKNEVVVFAGIPGNVTVVLELVRLLD